METRQQPTEDLPVVAQYQKPDIEIIEMELQQSLLASSAPDFWGEDW